MTARFLRISIIQSISTVQTKMKLSSFLPSYKDYSKWFRMEGINGINTGYLILCCIADYEEERAHHLLIILWAAQANALPAVFWVIYHLLQNPRAQNEIMMECEQILLEKQERDHGSETYESKCFDYNEIRKLDRSDLSKMVIFGE